MAVAMDATNTSTSSGTEEHNGDTPQLFSQLLARSLDDEAAPPSLLVAARDLRIEFFNRHGRDGAIIHQFHLTKKGAKTKKAKKSRSDAFDSWEVHCDVCNKPNALMRSDATNPPLYTFEHQHTTGALHLSKGREILATRSLLGGTLNAALDCASVAAAARSRAAVASQTHQGPLYDESGRRDATPVKLTEMVARTNCPG